MLNLKLIKTIILISIIITIIIFSIILINKNKSKKTENVVNTETESRVIFDTKINTNNNVNTVYDTNETSNKENFKSEVNIVEYTDGPEDIKYNQITRKLYDWNIIKDPELLRQALLLSQSADNEVVLESWRPFMSKNSSELIKLIYKSENIPQTKSNVYLIFQWYIELSGEFEKLPTNKKQEILKQYNELK